MQRKNKTDFNYPHQRNHTTRHSHRDKNLMKGTKRVALFEEAEELEATPNIGDEERGFCAEVGDVW